MRDSRNSRVQPCPVCGATMAPQRPEWWLVCGTCGMQASTLKPRLHDQSLTPVFDWEQRLDALAELRAVNARRLLDWLEKLRPPPARLLDVGCAEGWFLRGASERGYYVAGIEPDDRMARERDPALNIRAGFFPAALGRRERFDIITFNDVFEHLPNPRAAMAASARHLARDGLLAVVLPNALGGAYRLARFASRLGVSGPFQRMWQVGYPSPHLSYFTPATLARLAERHGLRERARFALPAYQAGGLWARVRYDRTRSLAYAVAVWAAAMAAMPLLAMLPSDISGQIFGKTGRGISSRSPRPRRRSAQPQ